MRKKVWCQYGLMAAAWATAAIAWRMRTADLNGLFWWNGQLDTQAFVKFLFEQPRTIVQAFSKPPLDVEKPLTLHSAWLAFVLLGFALYILGPMLVRRQNLWRAPGQKFIRIMSLGLLTFPLTLLAPPHWHLPLPLSGMYYLAAGHLLMFIAYWLTPSPPPAHPDLQKTSQ